MKRFLLGSAPLCAALALFLLSAPVRAQDANLCDLPGEAPDVIVGDLPNVSNYGNVGEYYAYSVGTTSCNIGSCWLNWDSSTPDHPVIAQNMYQVKDGRLRQIGQSWLKHGFYALSQELCDTNCIGTDGTHLGVNCSDPYTSGLNGSQGNLGPRSEVNPVTGEFLYPFGGMGTSGDNVFRRIQVHQDDLDPALNAGATYFVSGHYVTLDDSAAGNAHNNASWREITVSATSYNITLVGSTVRQQSATRAWRAMDPTISLSVRDIPNDGRIYAAAKSFINNDGGRRYEYSIENFNSDRGMRSFEVPVPGGATVTNIGFHDVDSHSGEPYDTTDWEMFYDYPNSRIVWQAPTYAENPNANAIRWGTLYSFWFDIVETATAPAQLEIGLFKPVVAETDPVAIFTSPFPAPVVCNNDGFCDRGETCTNCANDCTGAGPPTGFCGDLICDLALGEDCTNCADCAGVQGGPGGDRYCCGAGGGDSPVPCSDARCTAGGLTCGSTGEPFCCGDDVCGPGEDRCSCATDCGAPPTHELVCGDGIDDDCDGATDCGDLDCCVDAACITGADNDNDGVSDCDCDDGDNTIWGTPGEPGTLALVHDVVSGTAISWTAPVDPGGVVVGYETLRSGNVENYVFTSVCMIDPDPLDLTVTDPEDPASGTVYNYLVRVTNDCPGNTGSGPLGEDSESNERGAESCP